MGLLEQAPSQAFYFRRADNPLFACYHPPRGDSVRTAAVVLCQPLGSEYIRCHRAFRVLAEQLARAGFPVLRFDYRATGDSAGASSDGDLQQWVDDVAAAVAECRTRAGSKRVAAMGLRLGASLACLSAQQTGTLDALVLWDPVVSGRAYLKELAHQQEEFQRSLSSARQASAPPGGATEFMGCSYSPRLREQLGELDLQATPPHPRRMLVVGTTGAEVRFSAPAEHRSAAAPKVWLEDADRALVPKSVLDQAVGWLCEVYP